MGLELANATIINHTLARKDIVRQPLTTMRGLANFGFSYELLSSGLLAVQVDHKVHPLVVIQDDERFQSAQSDKRKHKILGFDPREWRSYDLLMLNDEWSYASNAADIVLQTAVLNDQLDEERLEATDNHVSMFQEPIQIAYNRFITQGLHTIYRADFLQWMMQE